MKLCGTYCSHDIEQYDVDHVINDVNSKVDYVLNHADTDKQRQNEVLIILSVIDSMTERLRKLK